MALCSAGVEYGIYCLLFPADGKGDSRESSVRALAESQDVPLELLAKVFTRLARTGLMAATEGVRDSFRLARPASGISVLDVVRTIDSDRSIFKCREVRERCAIFEGNPPSWATRNTYSIHAMMLAAQKRMGEVLAQQIILDLIHWVRYTAPPELDEGALRWMDASREGRGDPRDQPLAHMERRHKSASWKIPLSTVVLVAPAFLPTLSSEAAAGRPPAHCNGP